MIDRKYKKPEKLTTPRAKSPKCGKTAMGLAVFSGFLYFRAVVREFPYQLSRLF